jgi:hypothetical protein
MRRSLLFSCALHGVLVAVMLVTEPRRMTRESVGAVEIVVDVEPPHLPAAAIDVEEPAHTGGGGPAQATKPAALVEPARRQRRRPLAIRAVAAAAVPPVPEAAPGLDTPPATEESPVEVARGGAAPVPPGAQTDQPAAGTGEGAGAGNGLGDGFGDGFGDGPGDTAISRQLHARVLGYEVVDMQPRDDAPIISHDEATALRTRDRFPRLPESVWPEWRPYVVKLEICVGEDGHVREAVLRSSASPRLDPVVLAAAKTWQYRPRLVNGKPAPFCHGVVIKYERW